MSRLITNAIRSTSATADAITMDGSGNVTFPANATCSGTATGFGGGKLVNYSNTLKTDTFSQQLGQGGVSNDIISVSHTASSTNNKLLISYSINCASSYSGIMALFAYLYIGGSVSTVRGDASSSRARITTAGFGNNDHALNQSFQTIIQAASTNATTYSIRIQHTDNSTHTLYLNRGYDAQDANYIGRSCSSIQVLEFEPNT